MTPTKRRAIFLISLFLALIVLAVAPINAETTLIEFQDDTYLRQEFPTTDYSSYTYVEAGIEGASYYRTYSCFLLNETDLADIISAYDLGLLDDTPFYIKAYGYLTTSSPTYDMHLDVHRINDEFDASLLTWNNKPTYESENCSYYFVDGADFASQWHYFNVTDDFIDVLDNDGADFGGYLIKDMYGGSIKQKIHLDSIDGTNHPVLVMGEPNTDDEDTTPTYATYDELAGWLTVFLVVFLPALVLGGTLSANKQTQSLAPIGFVVGFVMGTAIGVATDVVPEWVAIFTAIAVISLIYFGRR